MMLKLVWDRMVEEKKKENKKFKLDQVRLSIKITIIVLYIEIFFKRSIRSTKISFRRSYLWRSWEKISCPFLRGGKMVKKERKRGEGKAARWKRKKHSFSRRFFGQKLNPEEQCLRVQLRRSRAENYFLQTSLGLFSSKQKHTAPGSKAHGLVRTREERNKMKVAGTGFRNIENVSFRARARCDKKQEEKEGKIYFCPFIVAPERNPFSFQNNCNSFYSLARVLSPSFIPLLYLHRNKPNPEEKDKGLRRERENITTTLRDRDSYPRDTIRRSEWN